VPLPCFEIVVWIHGCGVTEHIYHHVVVQGLLGVFGGDHDGHTLSMTVMVVRLRCSVGSRIIDSMCAVLNVLVVLDDVRNDELLLVDNLLRWQFKPKAWRVGDVEMRAINAAKEIYQSHAECEDGGRKKDDLRVDEVEDEQNVEVNAETGMRSSRPSSALVSR
jgi:hypothetical protein